MILTSIYFLAFLICSYTAINTLYLALFAIAGRIVPSKEPAELLPVTTFRRMAVMVPAYREDSVIVESVLANLVQTYPRSAYDLIVIADSFQPATLKELAKLPIRVIEVSFDVSTVAKALRAGMQKLSADGYDVIVVADADNHMAPDFLDRVNMAFDEGWRAVQGHRVAKNKNTTVAVLDAISEEINNHIFRKGHRALGISPSFIGSGMALEYGLMEQYITQTNDIGGYDKGLDMYVREHDIKIAYLENALIYDEKVQTGVVFEHQRTRWIEAHLFYLEKYFFKGIAAFFTGRFDYADKAFQLFILPRILLLGILSIGVGVSFLFDISWLFQAMGIQLAVLCFVLILSIPGYLIKLISIKELVTLPMLFLRFTRSTLNFRKARNRFLHTPHGIQTKPQDLSDPAAPSSIPPITVDPKLSLNNHE
ncbi:glycosyltransferase [Spirosoma validum]|uniref:Glycosyltransferase n=1 Tax=Spirosoma validum TaxID=2771355 RepID=A0A927GFV4_9BACT|nr:glycosyltransferase family 2 protein [Spirosoma validum]MBD2756219.1 glycosyltransferase [Spirosoma validum]